VRTEDEEEEGGEEEERKHRIRKWKESCFWRKMVEEREENDVEQKW